MSESSFEDIQKEAERIPARMNHYYLGVEHLFMALMTIEEGQAAAAMKQHGVPPAFIRYVIEVSLGQALDKRYWRGFRTTPRYEKVLTMAQNLDSSDERALLLGILDEGQSIPVRHLRAMGIAIEPLRDSIANLTADAQAAATEPADLESELPILAVEKALLADIYGDTDSLKVSRDLNVNAVSTTGRTYIVQREENSTATLIRFDSVPRVMEEKRRFDSYLGVKLPISLNNIALSTDPPLGAAVYDSNLDVAQLCALSSDVSTDLLDGLPQRLFDSHAAWMWGKRERYEFELWREYEAMLPPALVVDVGSGRDGEVLKPLEIWGRDHLIFPNTAVMLKDFTIQSVSRQIRSVTLCAGPDDEAVNRSSLITVMGFDAEELERYAPGQHVDSLGGRVRRTRQDILFEHIAYIRPNFDPAPNVIETSIGTLPNPLLNIPVMLQHQNESYLALIHGNLHGDFVVMDDSGEVALIDYSQVRMGHILFDWVMLELSILESKVMPFVDSEWSSVWNTTRHLESHLSHATRLVAPPEMVRVFDVLSQIREVASSLLGTADDWREYHAARALLAIARLGQTSTPLAARRLLFASATIATEAFLED